MFTQVGLCHTGRTILCICVCFSSKKKKRIDITLSRKNYDEQTKTLGIPPGRVSVIREGGVEKRMGKGQAGDSKKIERTARKPGDYCGEFCTGKNL